jgi:hypothetical protein
VAEHCRRGEAMMLENYGRHLLFPAKLEPDTSSTAKEPPARRGGGKGKVKKGRQREMERGKRAKGEKRRPHRDALATSSSKSSHDRRSPDLDCTCRALSCAHQRSKWLQTLTTCMRLQVCISSRRL